MPEGFWLCPNVAPNTGLMQNPLFRSRNRCKIQDLRYGNRDKKCNWVGARNIPQGWWLVYVACDDRFWDVISAESDCWDIGNYAEYDLTLDEQFSVGRINQIQSWLVANEVVVPGDRPGAKRNVIGDMTVRELLGSIHRACANTSGSYTDFNLMYVEPPPRPTMSPEHIEATTQVYEPEISNQ